MFKKIIISSSILALSSGLAVANPAPYVGASLGITTNTSSSAAFNGGSQPANFRGVPFSIFAGYGGIISQDFYLGGELTGTIVTGELSNNNGLKTSYGYGASVIPGVMLSDHTMAFARGGVVRTRFSNAGTTETGGQVGLGLQTSVTQNVDLRGEYDYVGFSTLNNSAGRVSAPSTDNVNLALVYKFD